MTTLDETTAYERGIAKLEEVTGQAGVQIVDNLGELGRYIVESVYGNIYSRPGMSLRERNIITVAILTAMGREAQLRVHMEASLRIGITLQEIEEIILQTVPYAGVPTAMNAMNILSELKNKAEE